MGKRQIIYIHIQFYSLSCPSFLLLLFKFGQLCFSESMNLSDIDVVGGSDAGSMREEPDAATLLATFFHRFPIFAFHAGGRGEQGGRLVGGGEGGGGGGGGGEGERD